ncbi:unnamed protein product, partial [Amoebophrya sp. A120]
FPSPQIKLEQLIAKVDESAFKYLALLSDRRRVNATRREVALQLHGSTSTTENGAEDVDAGDASPSSLNIAGEEIRWCAAEEDENRPTSGRSVAQQLPHSVLLEEFANGLEAKLGRAKVVHDDSRAGTRGPPAGPLRP